MRFGPPSRTARRQLSRRLAGLLCARSGPSVRLAGFSLGGRSSGQRGNAHGPPVAAAAFKKIAVLPVSGGMLYARKQQAVAVETAVLREILEQALRDLLVVRVVTEAAGGQRQLLHERLAVAVAGEIRLGPSDGLGSIECDDGGQGALQYLQLAQALGAGRKLSHIGPSIANILLMPGVAVEE